MSTPPKVKICGITRVEDAELAARLGADAVGLNFWPRSRRRVDVEQARRIVEALPPLVTAVGVFVNQPRDEVLAVAERVGLQVLQLHGDEPPAECAAFRVPVWKALRVVSAATLDAIAAYCVQGFVLDAPSTGYGGSGRTCDWDCARDAASRAPVILAGGLTPANVAEAIRAVRPWGVDVASGVESAPGVKDPHAMALFIQRAKETT